MWRGFIQRQLFITTLQATVNSFKEAACIPYTYSIFKLILAWIRFLLFRMICYSVAIVVILFEMKYDHDSFNPLFVQCWFFFHRDIFFFNKNNINTNINYCFLIPIDACAIQKFQYLVIPKYIIRERYVCIHCISKKKIFQKEFKYQVDH